MRYVAKFEKVSYEQFKKDLCSTHSSEKFMSDEVIRELYDNIKLPVRATKGSAGYDIRSPFDFDVYYDSSAEILIPTGLRCIIDEDWVMKCYPRSSLGFKYGVGLANTVGIIDSDYSHAKNEGHILIKLKTEKELNIKAGDAIAQAIFVPYGITVDDNAVDDRTGGIGSTGR